ncbi:unnamed protein product [Rhizophagus irregularis]|nr:unnamed protein product [Rhizophagus irregularis]
MSSHVFNRLAILVLLYSSVLAWNMLYLEPIGVGLGIYGGLSHVTLLSQAFDTFILVCASIILLLGSGSISVTSQRFESITKGKVAEYPLIIFFTTLGMSSLVSSSDLVTFFLSIELQSLALYILATIYRDSEAATSAGLKYFLVGALSSSLILLGSCLLYGLTGVSNFEGVYLLCSMAIANSGIHIALVIIGIALLFKVAAAPFHNWAPDVYDGVPTIVTTWLTIMPKVAILAFLGLIPYSFTATAHFALTLGFSSTILLGVTLLGLHRHGLHFFSLFVPAGTPLPLVPLLVLIESVSYLARAFSLGIRLAANMLAGHILLHIIATFSWKFIVGSLLGIIMIPLPLLFLTLLYGLEIGVALIQAYVFVLLTCSYINDAISLHSENSPSTCPGLRRGGPPST